MGVGLKRKQQKNNKQTWFKIVFGTSVTQKWFWFLNNLRQASNLQYGLITLGIL